MKRWGLSGDDSSRGTVRRGPMTHSSGHLNSLTLMTKMAKRKSRVKATMTGIKSNKKKKRKKREKKKPKHCPLLKEFLL